MRHNSDTLTTRLATVRDRIGSAERRFGREPGEVELLAVSKTRSADEVRALAELGQRRFGENYLQEGAEKARTLAGLGLEWHFIGPLQSNKTRLVAEQFDWVHSVDREKVAQRLNDQRPADLPPLQVCIQVNVSDEATKSGVTFAELPDLAAAVAGMPRLCLRGLMAIPAPAEDFDAQRRPLRRLREAFDALRATGLALDTLSMGMSDDLEAAVAEGATLVRVGTALFGARPAR